MQTEIRTDTQLRTTAQLRAESQRRIEGMRQRRGLLIHYRALPETIKRGPYRRGLITTFRPLKRKTGRCRWCNRETKGRAFAWHPYCVDAYRCALGLTRGTDGRWLVPKADCPCGQPGEELDHTVALSVAWATKEPRTILRAYMMTNLAWLCHQCHATKTGEDRRRANNIGMGRPADWRPPKRGDTPTGQLMLLE